MITLKTRDEINREVTEKVFNKCWHDWQYKGGIGGRKAYWKCSKCNHTYPYLGCGKDKPRPAHDERDMHKMLKIFQTECTVIKYDTQAFRVIIYKSHMTSEILGFNNHEDLCIAACLAALEAVTGEKYEYKGE